MNLLYKLYNRSNLILLTIAVFSLFSCREEVIIDLEQGEQMIGIYGTITTENKKHSITLSRSTDFYASGEPEMISNAVVYIFDGTDTIRFKENPQYSGIYETVEDVAGKVGLTYYLSVEIPDKDGNNRHFYAESTINPIPEKIDSAKIRPVSFHGREIENRLKVCPYFQTINDRNINYMIKIAVNDVLITDTLTQSTFVRMLQLGGVYFNGPEMEALYTEMDFPVGVYNFNTKKTNENIKEFDKITIYMYSVEQGFRTYIQDIESSRGSNPFMGTPSNVRSNIQPAGRAVGYFYAASMIEFSFLYYLNQ